MTGLVAANIRRGRAPVKDFCVVPKRFDVDHATNGAKEDASKRSQKGRGQNKRKDRLFSIESNVADLCRKTLMGLECLYEQETGKVCSRSHDVAAFLSAKPSDISSECPLVSTFGECPYGFACRFLSAHFDKGELKVYDVQRDIYQRARSAFSTCGLNSHNARFGRVMGDFWETRDLNSTLAQFFSSLRELKSLVCQRFADSSYQAIGCSELDERIHALEHSCRLDRETMLSGASSFVINNVQKPLLAQLRTRKYAYKRSKEYNHFLSSLLQKRTMRHSLAAETYKENPENVLLCEYCESVFLLDGNQQYGCLCGEFESKLFRNEPSNSEEFDIGLDAHTAEEVQLEPLSVPRNAKLYAALSALEKEEVGERLTSEDYAAIVGSHFSHANDPSEQYGSFLDPENVARNRLPNAHLLAKMERASTYYEARLKSVEKRRLDLKDKLYLAPLTTVGNLPFRRLCRTLGAEVTCSEMVVAESLLKGVASEWARLKRHSSEALFGAQICGGNVEVVTKACEVIEREMDVDFVDLNMGCPLEDVCLKGAGSGLMERSKRLGDMLRGMDYVLETTPVTAKIRIGLREAKPLAHKIAAKLHHCGVQALTLHGRTKEQRYSKYSNWQWIQFVSRVAKAHSENQMQVIGNGDILSWQEYYVKRERCPDLAGILIGRGALIKPWLFTEIAERRTIDITASERFELLRNFVKHGLEHWGSDSVGVSVTRRYLLELLSFSHRYVPVGLLERLPPMMNDKPPPFNGRNELETLLASPFVDDWVKITEMIPELGKAPGGYVFTPKHKANAYEVPKPQNV